MTSPLASTTGSDRARVVIIGAGAIGLAVARELAGAELAVTVVDRGLPGAEASGAAAGMIAPELEFEPGTQLWSWGHQSKALYQQFAQDLEAETSIGVDLRLSGLIVPVFAGEDEPSHVDAGSVRISRDDALALEPCLALAVDHAVLYRGAGSVDNRALVAALCASLESRRVNLRTRVRVEEVLTAGGRVCGVRTSQGTLPADIVVNCAGAWADEVHAGGTRLGVKPIKGHMLALDARHLEERNRPRRVLYRHTTYVVPRSDGRVIIGTTVEDCGFDKAIDPAALRSLRERAGAIWAAAGSAHEVEAWTGLRPLGAHAEPQIEALGPEGYFVAVGHYRNGILLTPITAKLVSRLIAGKLTALETS